MLRIPEQYSAGSAWRGNRRMTRLRRHPATYRPMALTLPGLTKRSIRIVMWTSGQRMNLTIIHKRSVLFLVY
ncbi:hypothetical protein LFZ40_17720 [Salmonella enterica subsp. enterica serovar Quebec str. S-1267]|uniref:Uncharacterized protein n=1 Tax=Salmonella enterica TaxID=28901 RepID=A0A743NI78_SALER|nr:hypothetical protein LFZ40_17720 [Salmonella enterica subsp. enterica serovar Quebec str. S-1267]HAF2098121.1 hypothetical protein [Salmonella enterica]